MRNYVTINGVDSTSLAGFLIQELPPFSLPKMRTKTETIDGRDGDIITKLGYSSIDKEISIGLYGAYDIDKINEFFVSEGIDYDRLVRFRTGKITFHCQPFKYDNGEVPVTASQSGDITVKNKGNTTSRPTLTIYGEGTITISLNGDEIFTITMGDHEYITIDTEEMNAYMGGVLLNRSVTGDYSSFVLNAGNNTVTITGTVTSVSIDNYSRWL